MSKTSLFRVEHIKTDDSTADHQYVDAYGHAGEEFEKAVRIQTHGYSSNPPAGSHGIGLRLRGESDLVVILGFEHPDYRVTDLGDGDAAFHNHKDKVVLKTKGDDLELKMPGDFTKTLKSMTVIAGGVTFKIDGSGVAITGGKVTHNGHDIGDTHKHKDTQPGSGLSGVPQ